MPFRPVRPLTPVALALGLALGGAGCKRLKTGAREEFARKYSCPEERVTVAERSDTSYAELVLSNLPEEAPPDEVKRDPGRLAKWQHDQQAKRDEIKDATRSIDLFEVSGCDHTALLGCGRGGNVADGDSSSEVICFEPARPK